MDALAIQNAVAPVVGLPLRCIGRAANLLWLHFGELRIVPAWRDGTKSVGQWAIHVQCPWRICHKGRIVVGRQDFYLSPDGAPQDDWDTSGYNCFDVEAAKLNEEFESQRPVTKSVNVDDVGGFSLRLAGDYRIDVFPASRDESCEHWRIFEPGMLVKHFVFRQPVT